MTHIPHFAQYVKKNMQAAKDLENIHKNIMQMNGTATFVDVLLKVNNH